MCGILFHLRHVCRAANLVDGLVSDILSPSPELLDRIQSRGPDSLKTILIHDEPHQLLLHFTSSVLSLRGNEVTIQPLTSDFEGASNAYVFCWNGEAWRYDGTEFGAGVNDGSFVFDQLISCDGNVEKVIGKVEGPFAFLFYDRKRQKLWFGRDWLGRRSLLCREAPSSSGPPGLDICSVSTGKDDENWAEVEADGIYCIDLHTPLNLAAVRVPFLQMTDHHPSDQLYMALPIPTLNRTTPSAPVLLTPSSPIVTRLHELLSTSLQTRIKNICVKARINRSPEPPSCNVAVLFSGGLDCVVLARLAHDLLPIDEPIELLNVAFENQRVIQAAALGPKKSKKLKVKPLIWADTGFQPESSGEQPTVEHISENVPSQEVTPEGDITSPYDICPDRITGRKSFTELEKTCPGREWQFKEINVPYAEALEHRSTVLSLIYPHETEMDFSIGLAFYFASRPMAQDSPRILLSGLGADELFGGYARHGTAFARRGYPGLLDELETDLGRLGKRNLGRDDRVISNWGREARFPYLDERLLEEVVNWRVSEKCDFGAVPNPDGSTNLWDGLDHEKKVLRLLAWKLGLESVATEKKRAIQFGARTAKMEASSGAGKVRGTQKVKIIIE